MSIPHVAYPRSERTFRSPIAGDIYAAQDPAGGPIKVGVSNFPKIRAQNVFARRGAEALPVLIAVYPKAGLGREQRLHAILQPWSTGEREWYEDCAAVRAILDAFGVGRLGAWLHPSRSHD